MKRILFFVLIVALLATSLSTAMTAKSVQVSSIGLSGSFYTFNGITLPRGGLFKSSDLYIVVYNYGSTDANVTLNTTSPKGIRVYFEPNNWSFTLSPGGYKRLNVVINVSRKVVPGTYKITITAQVVKQTKEGKVIIVPAETQEINIRVIGEYGTINVLAVDPTGAIAKTALVRLYTYFKGSLVSVYDSYTGVLKARVIPGRYMVRVYLAGDLVAEKNITVKPYENITLRIPIKVVFIDYFSIKPIMKGENNLLGVRILVVVKNVYRTITDAKMVLKVYKKGELWDQRELLSSSVLPKGNVQYKFDYIPDKKWVKGNYTFTIEIYGMGGKLLAKSPPRWLYYSGGPSRWMEWFGIGLAGVSVLALALYMIKRRKKKRAVESR